jgi:hypothetical protein
MFTSNVLENLDAATAETFGDPTTYTKSRGEVEAAIYSRWQERNRDDLQFEQRFVARETLARCAAIRAAGGIPDHDVEHAKICEMIGVSRQTAPAKYAKRPSVTLLPGQATEERKARAAAAECAAVRARGQRPDTDAIYQKHCG